MRKIAVIGSMNVDLVSRVPRFLMPGETLLGLDFQVFPGGKGGNQAVAASRLLPGVMMLGKLGDDANGELYRQVLRGSGIEADCVETVPNVQSGMTVIEVADDSGNNRIIYFPGANLLVDKEQVERNLPHLLTFDVFLLQLEIPLDTVVYAAGKLREAGKTVILDRRPAVPCPGSFAGERGLHHPQRNGAVPADRDGHRQPGAADCGGPAAVPDGGGFGDCQGGADGAYFIRGRKCTTPRAFRCRRWTPPPPGTASTPASRRRCAGG